MQPAHCSHRLAANLQNEAHAALPETAPHIPDHVPEKFRQQWSNLPGCCRNFYLNPGKGCCAGMVEPNPGIMPMPLNTSSSAITEANRADLKASRVEPVSKLTKDQKTSNNPGWLWAAQDWVAYFIKGFLADMKRLLTGRKTD